MEAQVSYFNNVLTVNLEDGRVLELDVFKDQMKSILEGQRVNVLSGDFINNEKYSEDM